MILHVYDLISHEENERRDKRERNIAEPDKTLASWSVGINFVL